MISTIKALKFTPPLRDVIVLGSLALIFMPFMNLAVHECLGSMLVIAFFWAGVRRWYRYRHKMTESFSANSLNAAFYSAWQMLIYSMLFFTALSGILICQPVVAWIDFSPSHYFFLLRLHTNLVTSVLPLLGIHVAIRVLRFQLNSIRQS